MRKTISLLLIACMLGVSSYVRAQAPQLVKKERLAKQLLPSNLSLASKGITLITPFAPAGDYSLEVKATVTTTASCGLSIEAKASSGKGFRVVLDAADLKWAAPYASPELLAAATGEVTLRFVVQGGQVHIYKGTDFLASKPLADVEPLNEDGAAYVFTPVALNWAGAEGENNLGVGDNSKYTDYGWSNTVSTVSYNVANGSGGLRYMDVTSGHTYNGKTYAGRIMILRWDGTYGTFTFPVTLEPNTSYEFSMLGEYWNNTQTTMTVGIDTTRGTGDDNTGAIATAIKSEVLTFGNNNALQKYTIPFTTLSADQVPSGQYYLAFNAPNGGMFGIAELSLTKIPAGYDAEKEKGPKLALALYCDGDANVSVSAVDYEDWTYAPGKEVIAEPLTPKGALSTLLTDYDLVFNNRGSKAVQTFAPLNLAGEYTVEVAATVDTAVGRGLDVEVSSNPAGAGFRTALNGANLIAASPYSLPLENIADVSDAPEQVIRYAVKDGKVHVYFNGEFVRTFTAQELGDMNAAGTAEISALPNTTYPVDGNLIANPEFAATENGAAPDGWSGDGAIGGGSNARVQTQNYPGGQLDYYGEGKKAFVIRYDGDAYGHYYAYSVTLEANTWYEYSFDMIAWGAGNRAFNVVVSTTQDGTGDVIATKTVTSPSAAKEVRREAVRFQTGDAGTYYLLFAEKDNNNAGAIGITDLVLTKDYSAGHILVGKNYTADTASLRVRYVAVDATGAYAPEAGTVVKTNQFIAFDSIPAQYFSTGSYQLKEAQASSGLPVTYSGSDDGVATVTPEGLITFVSSGTLTITAHQAGNDRYNAARDSAKTFTISNATPQTITFDSLAVQNFNSGTLQLTATASSGLPVTFSGDADTVATVTPEGLVTFVSAGTVNITAKQTGGEKDGETYDKATPVTLPLTIVKPVTSITFASNRVELRQGETLKLAPTLAPVDPTNAQLAWSSSDPSVVSVSNEGLLTAKLSGEVVITVSSTDSGIVENHNAVEAAVNVRVTPSLLLKEKLATVLLGSVATITEKAEITIPSFNPKGSYSLEVKAKVTAATACDGLDIMARNSSGRGFRITLSPDELKWAAPLASPEKLAGAEGGVEVALRLVVEGEQVHIYKGESYIASKNIIDVGDVDENGTEVFPEPEPTPVEVGCWDGCDGTGTQEEYGWDNSNADYNGWNAVNVSGGMRIMTDVNTLKYLNNDVSYTDIEGHDDRYMYIRWDAGDIIGTVWSFPITEKLEANTTYKFSLLIAYNSNSYANVIIGAGGSRSETDATQTGQMADALATKEIVIENHASESKVLRPDSVIFTTDTAGQYYLLLTAPKGGDNGPLYIITALKLQNMFPSKAKLLLSSRCESANITVTEVSYENRVFAPGKERIAETLTAKAYLSDTLVGTPAQRDLILVGEDGSKATKKLWFNNSGDYTVEVAATVDPASAGRGMDVEVHDAAGYGFRTALNTSELASANSLTDLGWLADAEQGEQLLRYAVKGDNVHVFFNNTFVKTLSRQAVGISIGAAENNTDAGALNLIANPDFAQTAVDGWPDGWKTDAPTYGVYGTSRVQQSADVLGAYPEGTKALHLRFDSSDPLAAKYYSYPVALKPATTYEYSFDLVAWGAGRENQSYFLVVSDTVTGTATYTTSANEEDESTVVTYSVSEVGANGVIALDTITTTAASGSKGVRPTLRFTTPASENAADTFYLTFAKKEYTGAALFGVTYLNLVEADQPAPLGLLVGKNYTSGAADVQVRYITVDTTGAYTPVEGTTPIVTGQDILFDSIPAQYFVAESYQLTEAKSTSRLPVTYSGDNDAVATVTPDGLVTFVSTGELNIIANVTTTSSLYTAAAPVSRKLVISPMLPQAITFEEIPDQYLPTGTLQLTATATSGLPVSFAGDADNVATVTPEGLITFLSLGTVNITATQAGGENEGELYDVASPVTRTLNIIPKPVTSVTLNVTSRDLVVGDTLVLIVAVSPDDATDKSVTWTSSSAAVATVTKIDDTTAQVIAIGVGSASITTSSVNDATKKAVCQVLVRSGGTPSEPTGVEGLGGESVSAYIAAGELLVNSPAAEQVEVYSIAGSRLLVKTKQAGEDKISVAHLQPQVLIVKGSSGWVKKILNN